MTWHDLSTRVKDHVGILKRTALGFLDHDCMSQAAALAYYTLFSLPPLLVIIMSIAGAVWGVDAVRQSILGQARGLVGERAAEQVVSMITSVRAPGLSFSLGAIVGVGVLLFSASGAFGQLQTALNRIWEVKPDPKQSEIRMFFLKRLASFGMILVIAFLLMVSLVMSATLAAFSGYVNSMLPAGISTALLQGLEFAVSLIVFTGLFGAMFKVLPDARLRWRDVALGGLATATLFSFGKSLIAVYVSKSDASPFGAAASLAVILLWIYYASNVVLLGAEFTHAWLKAQGGRVTPEEGAIRAKLVEKLPQGR